MDMRKFSRGEVELACWELGTGAPVVLIHGFPFDHTMWASQVAALCADYRLIVPDLRGFGRSTLAEAEVTAGVTMSRYAEDLLATLDHLQITEPVILCGFSMGGYILWQFVLQFPERVRAMVLCDSRAKADSPTAQVGRQELAESVLHDGVAPVAQAMVPKLLAESTRASQPAVVAMVEEMICRASPRAIAAAARGMAARADVSGELARIGCPALVLGGAQDAISPPEEMRSIAAALPNGRFVEIPSAGHLAPLENPGAVTAALSDFFAAL